MCSPQLRNTGLGPSNINILYFLRGASTIGAGGADLVHEF